MPGSVFASERRNAPPVTDRRAIEVHADWDGVSGPVRMGTLFATPHRRTEIVAFEYDDPWLSGHAAQQLDPGLELYRGEQYPDAGVPNFGLFLDSSPDRWGRVLLRRREAQRARVEGRRPRHLLESDYLLGVFDEHRMGALRFRIGAGPFLDDDRALASPPWASLRELEFASRRLEEAGVEDDPSYLRWLNLLLAPGRSLGGARPKAGVLDNEQQLWIAKFPSREDRYDIGAWEAVVHALARRAGVDVPDARIERFGSRHHTFLSRRFDRSGLTTRHHFASAMTLLGRQDGDPASYLELAEIITRHGARPAADLEQLWRRITFSVCVSNVDDHLRNHGFLLAPTGWTLAPAYDMNPVPWGDGLHLDISASDNALELDLVREVAPMFRVLAPRREEIIEEVRSAVSSWPQRASEIGLSRSEQERMAPAFAAVSD